MHQVTPGYGYSQCQKKNKKTLVNNNIKLELLQYTSRTEHYSKYSREERLSIQGTGFKGPRSHWVRLRSPVVCDTKVDTPVVTPTSPVQDPPAPVKNPTPAEIILSLLRKDPDGKYCNTFEVLSSAQVLRLAYEAIKSKPGNMARGVDRETLDGITLEWFEKTSRELQLELYQFRPNRRVYIPKANGKLRPLGIASPRDKIIQQAMNMVLETVLEPRFHDTSHGFRPFRGCHTALRQVKS